MNIYEMVAISEGWMAKKSGLDDLRNAESLAKQAREERKKAEDCRATALSNADDIDGIDYDLAFKQRQHSDDATNDATKYESERNKLLRSGRDKMEKFSQTGGSLAGAAAGALAGKGYSVYRRHQMKKRGATAKELAAHKKGDLRRMATGAGVGGIIGHRAGSAIGYGVIDKSWNNAGVERCD